MIIVLRRRKRQSPGYFFDGGFALFVRATLGNQFRSHFIVFLDFKLDAGVLDANKSVEAPLVQGVLAIADVEDQLFSKHSIIAW